MKIKTIFEPSDFPGMGQMVIRNSSPVGSSDISFAASVAYKIGYLNRGDGAGNIPVMVSLTDGMILDYPNIELLCKKLNDDPHGYRMLTTDTIVKIMEYVGNRFLK